MRSLHLLAISLTLLATTRAGPGSGQPIFPTGRVPGERAGTYGNESGHYTITNVTVPALYPRLVSGATTVVIICPGGAYKVLSWVLEGETAARWLNSLNVSAYILKYRVPLRPWLAFGEAQLVDLQRAVGVVRSQSPAGIKLGVLGFSAGAHLSAHLSNDWARRSYPRIDDADDLSARPAFAMLLYPWCVVGNQSAHDDNCDAGSNRTLSMSPTSETPSTFLVQAEDDPVKPENAIFYFLGLKTAHAPASELHVYPRGGHGFGLCDNRSLEVCAWPERAAEYLEAQGLISRPLPG